MNEIRVYCIDYSAENKKGADLNYGRRETFWLSAAYPINKHS